MKIFNDNREMPAFISTRFSDLLNFAEGKASVRAFYDTINNRFIFADGYKYIHGLLALEAIKCGLFPKATHVGEIYNGKTLIDFNVSDHSEKNNMKSDSYDNEHEYKGFYIYTRDGSNLFNNPNFQSLLKPYKKLNETREDLTKFNRIAGFYHLKTKKFELFPRTSEDISPEDDEVNDYIHNVHSKDEFTEFNIVRFGIEDIPGEGVICYIEGDTKRNVEKCYYAILEKYAEECDIIKYELEYYVGNTHKYIYLDRYGNQLMESVKPVNKELTDTKLITTAYELNAYLKNNTESRVVYDVEKNWFLVGNSETSIHVELINDALLDGLYPSFEWNGETYPNNTDKTTGGKILYGMHPKRFVLFRTSSDQLNGEDYYYDRYQYCYIYNDYCVFDRNGDFEGTPLYNYLGEPIDIENNGNVLEDEGIN